MTVLMQTPPPAAQNTTMLTSHDLYLFNEGSHVRLYRKMGAHLQIRDGVTGTSFAVWAPSAERVFVMGDFNGWNKDSHPLRARDSSGIWEGFVPGVGNGCSYKYHVVSRHNGYQVDKADPFGFHHETPPHTASKVWHLDYEWHDEEWISPCWIVDAHSRRQQPFAELP